MEMERQVQLQPHVDIKSKVVNKIRNPTKVPEGRCREKRERGREREREREMVRVRRGS